MTKYVVSPYDGGNFTGIEREENEVVSEINTTPLVDVMLVLLIIFLITIPVATHAIKVNLPIRMSHPTLVKNGNVAIAVNANGEIFWNEQLVADTSMLQSKLNEMSSLHPQPQIQIRGDENAHYETVGKVVKACQQAGIRRVDFITQPPKNG